MNKKSQGSLGIWQKLGLFFYDRRRITISVWLLVVLFGAISYVSLMRREGFPSVNVPIGVVRVISFDQDANSVDTNFTLPIIQSAKNDPSVDEITASSNDEGASIQLAFKDGTDVQKSLDELKSRVGDSLPDGAQVVYIKVNASKLTSEGDDLLISVHGDGLSVDELDLAAEKLVPIIKEKATLVQDVHLFKSVERVTNETTGVQQSQQIRFDRYYDKETQSPLPSVAVGVAGVKDVDQLELYDQIKQIIDSEVVSDIGADAEIAVDYAENIREQVSGLQRNLLEGLVVVLLVSFLLISARASIVTALSMTTTIAITVGVLELIGYTINTITLFSLVLCLALIVDDTTIMVESIDAGLKKSKKFRDVVSQSLKKVVRASATGTFTTVLAFAPMIFIGGILGEFVRAIPITIIISLLVSLIVSFIFIPLFMYISYSIGGSKRDLKIAPINRLEEALSEKLSRVLVWSSKTKFRSISTKLHAIFIAVCFIVGGVVILKTVSFNIFPAPKDGLQVYISTKIKSPETATITETERIADSLLNDVRNIVGNELEEITLLSQGGTNRNGFTATLKLVPINERKITSVAIAEKLQFELEPKYPELLLSAEAAGVGPPEGNFTVQIKAEQPEEAQVLAQDVKEFLEQKTLLRIDGTTAQLKDITITPANAIIRNNEERIINVTAGFDAKDVSALVTLAQDAVKKEFNEEKVASYGVDKDSVMFDFGQEEENQKSFESMGKAAGPLFLGMIILMAVLFKSVLQALLILTALPFAFFGVSAGLALTNNPLSFFSMLGIFALVGISVNNAILLTDFANQSAKEGYSPTEAMARALKARLRPLLTTSITSILALLPLALNDPFWEGLAYTLIFGLLSSTILVVLIFPYFYLIVESFRLRLRLVYRKLRPRN